MPGTKELVHTTCPRDCYDACGIVVIKRGGDITKVLGDPDHPASRGAQPHHTQGLPRVYVEVDPVDGGVRTLVENKVCPQASDRQ